MVPSGTVIALSVWLQDAWAGPDGSLCYTSLCGFSGSMPMACPRQARNGPEGRNGQEGWTRNTASLPGFRSIPSMPSMLFSGSYGPLLLRLRGPKDLCRTTSPEGGVTYSPRPPALMGRLIRVNEIGCCIRMNGYKFPNCRMVVLQDPR